MHGRVEIVPAEFLQEQDVRARKDKQSAYTCGLCALTGFVIILGAVAFVGVQS